MAVQLPCYCSREDVKRALDIAETAYNNTQIDRAIEAARDDIEGLCHRRFYNVDETHYWNWPNFQRAYPWRVWFDAAELADVTSNVPVVKSGGNVIAAGDIFWGPWNYSPPFTFMELNRSTSATYGQGDTPQQDISVQGTFGYWLKLAAAGTLAAAVTSTTATTVTVSDSSAVGVGDVLTVGSERMLVQERAMTSTGLTLAAGLTTALASDNTFTVTGSGSLTVGEVLLIDSERVLLVDVSGAEYVVKRAYDGSVLAAHGASPISAARLLTVTRGDLGTTAATYSSGQALSVAVVPALVRELSVAISLVRVLQETAGYARSGGTGSQAGLPPGPGLDGLRERVLTQYGRKARQRVV